MFKQNRGSLVVMERHSTFTSTSLKSICKFSSQDFDGGIQKRVHLKILNPRESKHEPKTLLDRLFDVVTKIQIIGY